MQVFSSKICEVCRNSFFAEHQVFLVKFAKFVRTPFLQNSTGQPLLIIAVSTVVKGELVSDTVNYDTKTKVYSIRAESVIKKGSPSKRTSFRCSHSLSSN